MKSCSEKSKKFSLILLSILGLVTLLISLFIFLWMNDFYSPSPQALNSLISTEFVEVTETNDLIIFTPTSDDITSTGIIIYPGAKVDARAYAPIAQLLSSHGYTVILPHMPLNFPILGTNMARDIMNSYSNINDWIIGGHSLGGVAASNFASTNADIDGVIFLASYPSNDILKLDNTPVISIYGTNDGVINQENLNNSKSLLPDTSIFVPIEGGNHSQFGDYGFQDGDNVSIMSTAEQHTVIVESILDWLTKLN